MLPLHMHGISQIVYAKTLDKGLIIPAKVFLYDETIGQNKSVTDRWTGRQTTIAETLYTT